MARIPMVTRTIKSTVCNTLCVNITTGETYEESITVPRVYEDDKALMKVLSKVYDVEGEKKALFVKSKDVQETLYGMEESEFIKVAKVLPPRTKEENTEEV